VVVGECRKASSPAVAALCVLQITKCFAICALRGGGRWVVVLVGWGAPGQALRSTDRAAQSLVQNGETPMETRRPAYGPALVPNSIAFGSAPRREVDSQPISQLDRPAVRQTETHTLGFLLVADTLCSSLNFKHRWWPSGNACHRKFLGRRFEPWCGEYLQRRRRCKSQQARNQTTDSEVHVGCVTIGPAAMLQQSASPLLEAC